MLKTDNSSKSNVAVLFLNMKQLPEQLKNWKWLKHKVGLYIGLFPFLNYKASRNNLLFKIIKHN
jgi:hypothetical protein